MTLDFSYDTNRDVENFMKGTKAVNDSKPTKFHQLYIDTCGETVDDSKLKSFIAKYIEDQHINIIERVEQIKNNWLPIQYAFIKRCEIIFDTVYPQEDIHIYLTTNGRCTYSIEKGFFFVRIQSANANPTIMHELFHFYTYHVFYKKIKDAGLTDLEYNNIKESLTELLNIDFHDLMGGIVDKGYIQHQKMRKDIRDYYSKNKSIVGVVDFLIQSK